MIDIFFIKDEIAIDSKLILELVKVELSRDDVKLIELTQKELLSAKIITNRGLVFSSIRGVEKNIVEEFCFEKGLAYFDILKVLKHGFKKMLKKKKLRSLKKMDETYFKRIEAMEFAVKYDDGKLSEGILQADLLIVGLSRTSKTPLSIYLANKSGLKIINIPLVPEMSIPSEVFEAKKVIGLTISIDKLNKIREQRLKTMKAEDKAASYASFGRILEELDYSDRVIKKLGCPVIDVSEKAIEETAEIVLSLMGF